MSELLKQYLESGKLWNLLYHIFSGPNWDHWCGIKWEGKYFCEVQKFAFQGGYGNWQLTLAIELYSDYGLGPRIYVDEKDLEAFLLGEPMENGNQLVGRGMDYLLEQLINS